MNTATFSSTMLVNITSNDPKEISDQVNKALNDVLSKLNNLSNSINTTQTQAQATFAPMPQSAAGVGQFYPINSGSGGSLAMQPGGLWIYAAAYQNIATGGWGGAPGPWLAGFASGGVTVAGTAGLQWLGWAYRYA